MTFGELKLKISRYILVNAAAAVTPDTTLEPLIEQAINAARKWAERDHDFDWLRTGVIGTVPGTGAGLDWFEPLPTAADSEVDHTLKIIEDVFLWSATGDAPIRHTNRRQQAQRVKDLPSPHYLTEDISYTDSNYGNRAIAVLHGSKLFLDPHSTNDVVVRLDGVRWADDYSTDADEDWFLKHGHDFLFWQALVEVNHVTKIFVYRQEGNVMPPEKMAAAAYETLKRLDDYIYEGNNNYDRE